MAIRTATMMASLATTLRCDNAIVIYIYIYSRYC